MDKPTVYGSTLSGNCLKIKYVLDALAIDYEWVEMDLRAGDTQTEKFLQINPTGQVPTVLLPDGRILAESNAILYYFGKDTQFWPQSDYRQAQLMQWLFWEQYSHEPFLAVRRSQILFYSKRDDELDPNLLIKGRRALAIMDQQLLRTEFLMGPEPTLADIALYPYTKLSPDGGFNLDEFINVMSWLARTERLLVKN